MPVVGLISSDGKSDHPEGQGRCSFPYALQLCADGDEAFPYPYPLLKGIVNSIQDRGEYISVTSVLHCLRGDFLKRTEPYYATVDQMYPMFRGTLFHSLLEPNPSPHGEAEIKALRTYKGIEIGGTTDHIIRSIHPVTGRYQIDDWKTTDNLPRYGTPYTSHGEQVNLYRWLFDLPWDKTDLYVHYFSMKGYKRTKVKQNWDDKKVEAILDDRLVKLKASFVTRIPMPYVMVSEDQKWECEYCPVRQLCADLAREEAEATWRRRAGLSATEGPGDQSTTWAVVEGEVRARIDAAYPKNVAAPAKTARRKRGE